MHAIRLALYCTLWQTRFQAILHELLMHIQYIILMPELFFIEVLQQT
jgi:hypothetical protein